MKIGILTFHFADNYGALLQAYALRKYILHKTDDKVVIINYANKKLSDAYNTNPFLQKKCVSIIKAMVKYPIREIQASKFRAFRRKKLGLSNPDENSVHLPKDINCYVVGSDQVWNGQITFSDENYYLKELKDNKLIRRTSYAASADNAFLSEENYAEIIQLLSQFDAISVREKQLAQVLQEKAQIKSSVVLDPVFLLDRQEWSELGVKPVNLPSKYILYYALKPNEALDTIAQKLKDEMKLPVVVVHPIVRKITKVGRLQVNVGPEEFVKLIENAEVVVSNSFHAFAFSCIFSKTIYFDYLAETSNRITSLIDLLKIKIENSDSIYYANLDIYGNEAYTEWLNISKKFIADNIIQNKWSQDD